MTGYGQPFHRVTRSGQSLPIFASGRLVRALLILAMHQRRDAPFAVDRRWLLSMATSTPAHEATHG